MEDERLGDGGLSWALIDGWLGREDEGRVGERGAASFSRTFGGMLLVNLADPFARDDVAIDFVE
jgi:hypothetical protein